MTNNLTQNMKDSTQKQKFKTIYSQLSSQFSYITVPILILQLFLILPFQITVFWGLQGRDISPVVAIFVGIISVLDVIFLIDSIYNLAIGSFGLKHNRLERDSNNNLIVPKTLKKYNFALIVCAHNEQAVIGNTLQEMLKCNYPKSKLKIVVICDNCSDNTYKEANRIAVDHRDQITVLARTDTINKGKPFAVKYAFDWIEINIPDYEAVSIADADNIYHKEFFGVMNWKLNTGSQIIQGYLGVKNQYDSMVSAASTLSYFSSAMVYWVSRQNIGMSGTIGGTGFVLSRNILEIIGWDMISLTEDLEFSTKAVLMGYNIDYAYDAITYDEKPTTLKVSFNQRKRWMQGHQDVMIRYIVRLILALLNPTKWNKLSLIDYILYLLRPTKKLIYGYFCVSIVLISITNNIGLYSLSSLPKNIYATGFVLITTMSLEYFCAVREGFKWYKIKEIIYYYTLFNLNDYLATFSGVFLASPKGVWVKTEHKILVTVEKAMSN